MAVGDFNGDGRPDVAVANAGSGTVSVLLNDGGWPDRNAPSLSIGDATVTEGNAGTVDAVFTVTLSAAYDRDVTVRFETADGSAGRRHGRERLRGAVGAGPSRPARPPRRSSFGLRRPPSPRIPNPSPSG